MPKRKRSDSMVKQPYKKQRRGSYNYVRYAGRRAVLLKETGYVDLANANYQCDTTGSITLIATVAQGTSVNQRVGKKIRWKSLQFRGEVQNNSTATITDNAVLIVYDNRPSGSLPNITDILDTANSQSFNNDANSGRFRVLKRLDFHLIGNTTSLTSATNMSADFYLDLKGFPCEFGALGTGAIGDISRGALYLVTVGNMAAGTTSAVLNGGFRTRFVDV